MRGREKERGQRGGLRKRHWLRCEVCFRFSCIFPNIFTIFKHLKYRLRLQVLSSSGSNVEVIFNLDYTEIRRKKVSSNYANGFLIG